MKSRAQNKIWFPRRKLGWGIPCAWQGWTVLIAYIVLIVFADNLFPFKDHPALYISYKTALTVALIAVCAWKGGPPPHKQDSEKEQ